MNRSHLIDRRTCLRGIGASLALPLLETMGWAEAAKGRPFKAPVRIGFMYMPSTAGGTSVTITGTGLLGATSVTLGGTAATTFSVVNATTITAMTPAHVAGAVSVWVTTPGGYMYGFYIYGSSGTAVSPVSGSTDGGTVVTITGTGFTGATSVTPSVAQRLQTSPWSTPHFTRLGNTKPPFHETIVWASL